jgi:hypothetical protein
MKVCPVTLDIKLGADALIDLFMVQWHTPVPARGHAPAGIPPQFVEQKREVLRQFLAWLPNQAAGNPLRPLFIIIPELSMPPSELILLEELVQAMHRPTVVVAGMEYQQWTEFQQLVLALPDMPEPQSWLEDGQPHHWVNAARIWIRDEHGQIKRFVQPKRHPQADEQAIPLYQGKNVLVFRSSTQADGQRLNFLTQICSDFTDVAFVRELRHQVAVECEGLHIDFTILLQMNQDQEAEQFKHAVKEYFEPPLQLAHTEDGALLFVNNACDKCGKSVQWGDSRFHFAFQRGWPEPDFAPPTYWMREEGPHNFQAVAFRERGPGIYWVRYKPHYLVSRVRGGPQLVPFPETHALFAAIDGRHLGATAPANLFAAIPAVCHWLFSEWQEGQSDLDQSLEADETARDVAARYLEAYADGVEEWHQAIAGHDEIARDALNIYFECWQGDAHPKFPGTKVEPLAWCLDASRGVKCFLNAYGLLKLGAVGFPGSNLRAHPEGVSHGISQDDLRVTLMWGGGQVQPAIITTRYLAARRSRGAADLLCRKMLLVLLQSSARMNTNDLSQRFNAKNDEFTKGHSIADVAEPGEVVAVAPPEIRWMYSEDLVGQVHQAGSRAELELLLANAVRTALV